MPIKHLRKPENHFSIYNLFFLLTLSLLFIGFITKDFETYSYGWHTTIRVGFWSFISPSAICSLIFGLSYWCFKKARRIIDDRIILLHFILFIIGLLLFLIFGFNESLFITQKTHTEYKVWLFSGPFIMICSLLIFLYGIATSKKSTKEDKPE